jgi:titin
LEALEDRTLPSAYTVTSTADSGPGSLRQAILDADANPGPDVIAFNVNGGGAQTIAPTSALPDVTDAVTIDGTTQPGFAGTPIVELNGALAGAAGGSALNPGVSGLTVLSDNCTIRGLVINRFSGSGITLGVYATPPGVNDVVVAGNYIGTDVSGNVALGNHNGVYLGASSGITIGGTDPGAGNVISANSTGILDDGSDSLTVQGNRIGTNAAGTAALGNVGSGIVFEYGGNHAQIGGTTAAARNLISGNFNHGMQLYGTHDVQIQGNYIGTDVTGTAALPNYHSGIAADAGAFGNTIGGNVAGAGNVISSNLDSGVFLLQGAHDFVIAGNLIGTDATGTQALGNGAGIDLLGVGPGFGDVSNTRIERNVISGNAAYGIVADGSSIVRIFGTTVAGNYIGTDVTGTAALGNAEGVWLSGWSQNSVVGGTAAGTGNLIAFNTDDGVQVSGAGAVGNLITGNVLRGNTHDGVFVYGGATGASILGNSISASGDLGIRLDAASNANHNQAAPVLTAAAAGPGGTTVTGTLTSTANTTFRVEFFSNAGLDASGNAEGLTYLGFALVTTGADGTAFFTATNLAAIPAGQGYVTATATDLGTGDTSPFSLPVQPATGPVGDDQTAGIGFWHNKNGQTLIQSLNGGPGSTQLADWLAATFPNLYGAGAGANGLTGKTNAEVAAFYLALFNRTGPKLEAQVLAVALAVYVTDQGLAGNAGAVYGFQVTAGGVGGATFNVGSAGAAFGAANDTSMAVLDILQAADARTRNGLLYDQDGSGTLSAAEQALRNLANLVFTGINELGDI